MTFFFLGEQRRPKSDYTASPSSIKKMKLSDHLVYIINSDILFIDDREYSKTLDKDF